MKIAVSEFKARCATLLREVQAEYKTIEVTRRGKVIAVIHPPESADAAQLGAFVGSLRGAASEVGDIVMPAVVAEEWDASR